MLFTCVLEFSKSQFDEDEFWKQNSLAFRSTIADSSFQTISYIQQQCIVWDEITELEAWWFEQDKMCGSMDELGARDWSE